MVEPPPPKLGAANPAVLVTGLLNVFWPNGVFVPAVLVVPGEAKPPKKKYYNTRIVMYAFSMI
jgi:hypothetical protein